jgi:NTE family protein
VFDNFDEVVACPLRRFCSTDIRTPVMIGWRLDPANLSALIRNYFSVPAEALVTEYKPLFEDKALTDIAPQGAATPRFVFCATSIQTGACWHFHGGPNARMGDFYSGYFDVARTTVATAVAASSAFPPGFGALCLRLPPSVEPTRIDPWGATRPKADKTQRMLTDWRGGILLTDGGVYDNLGLEPVWNQFNGLVVSDAGKPFSAVVSSRQFVVSRLARAAEVSSEQVGSVRKRWLFEQLQAGQRQGVMWQINTRIANFGAPATQGYPPALLDYFDNVRTDLNCFSEGEIACLENHGYSLADAAVRRYAAFLCTNPNASFNWPHPAYRDAAAAEHALSQSHRRRVLRDIGRYLLNA